MFSFTEYIMREFLMKNVNFTPLNKADIFAVDTTEKEEPSGLTSYSNLLAIDLNGKPNS